VYVHESQQEIDGLACLPRFLANRVRQTETRLLWSISLGDKALRIWQKEESGDQDSREEVRVLSAAVSSLEADIAR
jgi:hypothetical protein